MRRFRAFGFMVFSESPEIKPRSWAVSFPLPSDSSDPDNQDLMGTGHSHPHGAGLLLPGSESERGREARRVTLVGGGLRVLLVTFELGLGLFFGSRALLADAVHTFSDLLSDAVVLGALRFSGRPPDADYPFGRGKVESLAAFVVAILLLIAGLGIIGEAMFAMARGESHELLLLPALGALAGIVVQEFSFRWTRAVGERLRSPALIANAWHHRSDVLSSVAALIGVVTASVFSLPWMDSVAAILVGLLILRITRAQFRESFRGLIDAAAPAAIREKIAAIAVLDPAVVDVHHVRAREVGHAVYADLHAVVHPEMTVREACAVARRIEAAIMQEMGEVRQVLVHVEPAREGVILDVVPRP